MSSLLLILAVVVVTVVLQKYSSPVKAEWTRDLSGGFFGQKKKTLPAKQSAASCSPHRNCPSDHFSFFLQSGAANVVGPKICVQNQLVLGSVKNNAGPGINIVIINGRSAEVLHSAYFNMYSGDVSPLIELLKNIQKGSIVLMASYDDPSTKLTDDARKLISELGSSAVSSLGFRDNWVFVGGKGFKAQSDYEKHLKNDKEKNKYENWPELIQLQGCIPKYPE
ncbi:protein FAM3C-like%2C partial [Scomber scombrus]|uniref:Protein FAM3C-like, partial n=1 Tax=Scomber scombrus TaxID=13677 RepID=A0AAV1QKT8_SCOSC